MSRWRWPGRLAGALAVATLLVGSSVPVTRAAPNPFGPRSTATTIVLNPDGSYDVTLRQSHELVREFAVTFGGGVHDGFRLPDDGALLPPYLRAGYALTSVAAADGQPEPADFTRTTTGSRWRAPAPTRRDGTGSRSATGDRRGGADGTRLDRARRLLDVLYSPGDRVEVLAASVAPTALQLRCVTYPPDSQPCGTTGGPTLIDVVQDDRDAQPPPESVIEVEADNAAVALPTIDRR